MCGVLSRLFGLVVDYCVCGLLTVNSVVVFYVLVIIFAFKLR